MNVNTKEFARVKSIVDAASELNLDYTRAPSTRFDSALTIVRQHLLDGASRWTDKEMVKRRAHRAAQAVQEKKNKAETAKRERRWRKRAAREVAKTAAAKAAAKKTIAPKKAANVAVRSIANAKHRARR